MTNRYRIDSDSRSSARVLDPVVLWTSEDGTRRLAFLPHLHDNPSSPEACLSGQLRYQRKTAGDEFEDEGSLQLSNLHNGQWTKYELSSAATLELFRTLDDLYQLYAQHGTPRRQTTLISVEGDYAAEVDALGQAQVGPLLRALISRATGDCDAAELAGELAAIGSRPLEDLRAAIGVANLRTALSEWDGLPQSDESAWQRFFAQHQWILAQAFAQPLVLIRSGAVVRPEDLSQAERQIVDYVYANALTRNLALVEIKTPSAEILAGTEYRRGIYRPSAELTGSVAQIGAYRHNIKQYAYALLRSGSRAALRTDPRCVVVIGTLSDLDSDEKVTCFEQYRRELRNIEVLTFDELRTRAQGILGLLGPAPDSPDAEDAGGGGHAF